MAARTGLFVNLDRCFGCFTCEVACQQENRLPADEKWIRMYTVGPTEVDGELVMDFVPLASDKCDLCAARRAQGQPPACVAACPARALIVAHERQLPRLLRSERRLQLCKLGE